MPPARRSVYRHADLRRVLEPQSIAIVGASPTPDSYAAMTLNNLRDFKGRVHLVNAKYERIGDRPCYPSVAALPEAPDMLVITIGRDSVEPVIRDAIRKGAGGAAIYAAGYAETGRPEEVALQNRLAALARESGFRIIGPNVVGLVNHVTRAAMSFAPDFECSADTDCRVGLISQSGGVSNGLTQVIHLGIALSHTLSVGNSCDVDVADYLAYLAEDPGCRSIAMIFEGLESTERLMEAGEILVRSGKPLAVMKLGRGESGAAAAKSHTGFLAGSNAAYAAAFRRMGAVVVESYHALCETAGFLAKAPKPSTGRTLVASGSGGTCVDVADVADDIGFTLEQPRPELRTRMQQHMPDFGAPNNPCDVTAAAQTTERLTALTDLVLGDRQYDILLYPNMYLTEGGTGRLTGMGELAAKHGKMVVVTLHTDRIAGPGHRDTNLHPNMAVFRDARHALRAIQGWSERAAWLAAGPRKAQRLSHAGAAARAAALIEASPNATLTERESKAVLAEYGVPVTGERLTLSPDEAASAAKALGYPVVLKVESPDLPHKTEAGVIRLNLKDEAELRTAFEAVMANAKRVLPAPRISGVLVQPMVPTGTEMMAGARIDPMFGPIIVAGLGGVLVELLKDTSSELAPVTIAEAKAMLARLRTQKYLAGFRGAPAIDVERYAEIIVRLSEFASDQKDRIAELDVNPLICAPDRIVAVDALIVKR